MLQGVDGRSGVPGLEGEKGDKVRTQSRWQMGLQVIYLLTFRDSLVQKESREFLDERGQSDQQ